VFIQILDKTTSISFCESFCNENEEFSIDLYLCHNLHWQPIIVDGPNRFNAPLPNKESEIFDVFPSYSLKVMTLSEYLINIFPDKIELIYSLVIKEIANETVNMNTDLANELIPQFDSLLHDFNNSVKIQNLNKEEAKKIYEDCIILYYSIYSSKKTDIVVEKSEIQISSESFLHLIRKIKSNETYLLSILYEHENLFDKQSKKYDYPDLMTNPQKKVPLPEDLSFSFSIHKNSSVFDLPVLKTKEPLVDNVIEQQNVEKPKVGIIRSEQPEEKFIYKFLRWADKKKGDLPVETNAGDLKLNFNKTATGQEKLSKKHSLVLTRVNIGKKVKLFKYISPVREAKIFQCVDNINLFIKTEMHLDITCDRYVKYSFAKELQNYIIQKNMFNKEQSKILNDKLIKLIRKLHKNRNFNIEELEDSLKECLIKLEMAFTVIG
jgi:hypothetical protein